ncbi:POTRA domain-containing protein [uncultured Dokdonia sp.]|uniref:BamA/OMP85 family outer membrane protein n=1 Tax=uncultured Dokdonia sp. TaxID=575653 RepID=UPI0030EF1BE2|tara:strand:- start:282336 stop:285008 length:2673 start_codon:yes stop_codon:yes gene_type:complete
MTLFTIIRKENEDLERQVNKLNSASTFSKVTSKWMIFLALLSFTFAQAQRQLPLDPEVKYEIADIKVSGVSTYNENTVIAFTGLRVGERIFLPGQKITDVIKKLWGLELFSDINLYVTAVNGDKVDLQLDIKEVPELNEVRFKGIKQKKGANFIKDNGLNKGAKVTENLETTAKNYIENTYKKKGYLNSKVFINTVPTVDSIGANKVNMTVNIDKGERVKIADINIIGREKLKEGTLLGSMKSTKEKKIWRVWKRSKFIKADYEEDKVSLINKYKEKGYRDARIVSDTIIKNNEKSITIEMNVEEGNRYYIGDIDFIGNSVYTDEQLSRQLGLFKGDVYNGVLLKERIQDDTDPDSDNIANLYQNSGYLFSNINAVETSVQNDTIDFEVRISEGKLAYFNKVTVKGNDKTKDKVIYRELLTKPGQRYSKAAVVGTIRELGQLGFFDAQQLTPNFDNFDAIGGTVDLEYNVVEQGASQIELQGGFGGGGFVGTLGLSFNNFSIQNIFNKDAYQPLPMGDGQKFSLRAQASQFFQTYSASLTDPWFGGKQPVQFSTSFSHTIQYLFTGVNSGNASDRVDRDRKFLITGGSIGLSKRLSWPDRQFSLSHAISFQHFDLQNYNTGLFTFGNGSSENLAYTIGLSRSEVFGGRIFPTGGSEISVTAKLTLPYSAWNGTDYKQLAADREIAVENQDSDEIGRIDQERFNWLEYYKVKFDGKWYTPLAGKLVLQTGIEFGWLGAYNQDRGVPPFERFFLGGDGLGGFSLDGREIVRLRGYPNQAVTPIDRGAALSSTNQANDGATIYNKFSLELRYPISFNPQATIYALTFAEAGSSYDNFRDYNPFQLSRSAGAGIRIFMPAFGLLGLDFGYGFDPIPGTVGANGWETHFIIGQQF